MHRILVQLAIALTLLFVLGGCAIQSRPSLDYTEAIGGTTITFDMVWIEEGNFWIGRTEVTWNEYLAYCAFEGDEPAPPGADAVTKPSKPLDTSPYDRDWGKGTRPAVGMSWNAAKKYCQWLSINTGRTYRLPTEDEWLLACGREIPRPLADHAWFADNSQGMTHPVGEKLPNAHGVYDMLGNLWEYCSNPYSDDEPERAVLRGGAWNTPAADVSPHSRLKFNRLWVMLDPNMPPGVWWVPDGEHLGFRVLCEPNPDETRD